MNLPNILSQTDIKQRRASDPTASAFVAANAGSGKTYVLVRRILRLLLEGTDPSRILALTYTTAAAANMSNRVFKELSEWVSFDERQLSEKIRQLDDIEPTSAKLKLARQLFARTVETPGGLKIQTIHAFCERVLHLFPFEANIPANFEIIDDRLQSDLLAFARTSAINKISDGSGSHIATSVAELIDITGEHGFAPILATALKQTKRIQMIIKNEILLQNLFSEIANKLNINPADRVDQFYSEIYDHRLSDIDCNSIFQILLISSPNDQKTGQALQKSINLANGANWREFYFSAFLKSTMEPRSDAAIVTKATREKYPQLYLTLCNERDRVCGLLDHIKSIEAYNRTRTLLIVSGAVFKEYEAQKLLRGALDFDDLIYRTKTLLQKTSAQWVLYKLDNGIEHVLVDEAQDTSPDQWEILKLLTSEFYSGHGSKLGVRTIFAVGDPKQSIYSFQGAEPKAFSDHRAFFQNRFSATSQVEQQPIQLFHSEQLTVSFRSTPEILYAVDKVFSNPENYKGLDTRSEATIHASQRLLAPGIVEIWPPLVAEPNAPCINWDAPLDEKGRSSPPVLLARALADHIGRLIDPTSTEQIFENLDSPRPILPGDILILVRKRGMLFEAIIRALKERRLPVAGADRLNLNDHIAVMDLVALGKSLLTPNDDLTLATVLKSPLFGLNEEELLLLASERQGSLVDALMSDTRSDTFVEAALKFQKFQEASARNSPFAFYSFVLGPCGGRRSFRARLGIEADDAINEFLRLSLEYEQREAPSLLRFLENFVSTSFTIKRDMDSGRNEIRVMTVHGAKGLEAPVVYLPDTFGNAVDKKKLDPIFNLDEDQKSLIPIWSPSLVADSAIIGRLREEAVGREAEEHRRLLYVALTRARDRLYIAGCHSRKNRPPDCWYSLVDDALKDEMRDVAEGEAPAGSRRLQINPFPSTENRQQPIVQNDITEIPDWLFTDPPKEYRKERPLRPSDALRFGDFDEQSSGKLLSPIAKRRGILVHKLLEYLPSYTENQWVDAGLSYLNGRAADLDEALRLTLVDDVVKVLQVTDISDLFSASSRAEIGIAGELHREGRPSRRVSGTIDRIAVVEDTVFIADFKTTASPPSSLEGVPERTLAQIAIYRELVGGLYPDKKMRCFVIYTTGPEVIELPDEILRKALSFID